MTTPQERQIEMLRYCEKYGYEDSAKLYEHMQEKYPDVTRAAHRGMFGRLYREYKARPPKPVAEPVQTDLLTTACFTGRTSSKQPNPSNKPKSGKQKTGKTLPPKKGREQLVHVDTHPESTVRRQERVLELYHSGDVPKTEKSLLRAIKQEFTKPADPPTLAMIVQVLKAEGDHERYPAKMAALFGHRVCPTCGKSAVGVDDIFVVFGFREQNARSQSYCRDCRSGTSKQKLAPIEVAEGVVVEVAWGGKDTKRVRVTKVRADGSIRGLVQRVTRSGEYMQEFGKEVRTFQSSEVIRVLEAAQ